MYIYKAAVVTLSSSKCSNSGQVLRRFQMMKQINKILVRLRDLTLREVLNV